MKSLVKEDKSEWAPGHLSFTFLPHEILTAGSNNESCINGQTITTHLNPQDLLRKCKLEWEC